MEETDEVGYQRSCRLCGSEIEEGSRSVKKEKVKDLFKSLYNITLSHDKRWLPKEVHYGCRQKLDYAKTRGNPPPPLKDFPPPTVPRKRKRLVECSNKVSSVVITRF